MGAAARAGGCDPALARFLGARGGAGAGAGAISSSEEEEEDSSMGAAGRCATYSYQSSLDLPTTSRAIVSSAMRLRLLMAL